MKDEAFVVYVYVDDEANTITPEDITDWLSIIDPVQDIKLQFDAACNRPCYCVRFAKAHAAEQASRYLSGAKLKNCNVRITSPIYETKPTSTVGHHADTARGAASLLATVTEEEVIPPSPHIPANHEMPASLRMDGSLAPYIATLLREELSFPDTGGLVKKLSSAQNQYLQLMKRSQEVDSRTAQVDADLSGALRDTKPMVATLSSRVGTWDSILSQSPSNRWIWSSVGVSRSGVPPPVLFSHVTERFGPVSSCCWMSCSEDDGETYVVGIQFLRGEDADTFAKIMIETDSGHDGAMTTKATTGVVATCSDTHQMLHRCRWQFQSAPAIHLPRLVDRNVHERVLKLITNTHIPKTSGMDS